MTCGVGWSLRLPLALAITIGPFGVGEAVAQSWSVSAAAGRIVHDGLGDRTGTVGTTLGAAYEGPQWLYLTVGVPFDSAGIFWSALGAGGRVAMMTRSAAIGVDLAGHLYGLRERRASAAGSGATLEAMPVAAIGGSRARLELRSGIRYCASSFDGSTISRRVHQSDARLSVGSPDVRIVAEGRHLRAEEADYPYLGAQAAVSVGMGTIWALAGTWLSDEIDTPVWGVGGMLAVARSTELFASIEQETSDPLYWHAPRRSWSVGLNRRIGRMTLASSSPVGVPEIRAGEVLFRLPAGESEGAPRIGGDFTDWAPVAMQREGDFWVVTLPVASGVHRYAYQRADGEWFVPESLPDRVEDGFGGYSATLIVP